MMEKESSKEEKKIKDRFVITEVPTQTVPVIKDTSEEDTYYNELTMLCKLANEIELIKKGLL